MKRTALGVLGIVGAIVVVVALVIGSYQLDWWVQKDTRQRTDKIVKLSRSAQEGLVFSANQNIQISLDPNQTAEGKAFAVKTACAQIDQVSDQYRTNQLTEFYSGNC